MIEAVVMTSGNLDRSKVELGESLESRGIVVKRRTWVTKDGMTVGVQ